MTEKQPLNMVYLGDCLDLMEKIKPKSVDFIFADIPYNTTACDWDKDILPLNKYLMIPHGNKGKTKPVYLDQWLLRCYEQDIPRKKAIETFEAESKDGLWDCFKRVLTDKGVVAMTASQPFTTKLVNSNRDWFVNEWIWDKVKGANFLNIKNRPLKTQEQVVVFSLTPYFTFNGEKVPRTIESLKRHPKGKIAHRRRGNSIVEHYDTTFKTKESKVYNDGLKHPIDIIIHPIRDKNGGPSYNSPYKHPTKKPLTLLRYLLKTYTNESDLVLDPTAGSGTTGVAALELNRRFILMEKDPGYFAKIESRLQDTRERLGQIKIVEQIKEGNTRQLGLF